MENLIELEELTESFYNGNFSYGVNTLLKMNISIFKYLEYIEDRIENNEEIYLEKHFNSYFWLSVGQDYERMRIKKFDKELRNQDKEIDNLKEVEL